MRRRVAAGWGLAALLGACEPAPEPADPLVRDCALSVRFTPGALRGEVALEYQRPGEALRTLPLRAGEGGVFGARVDLPPGPVRYRLRVGDQRFTDADAPQTVQDADGVEHSYVEIPDCTRAAWALSEREDTPGGVRFSLRAALPPGVAPNAPPMLDARLDGRPVSPAETWPDAVTFDFPTLAPGKHHFTLAANGPDALAFEPFAAPFWVSPGEAFRWEDAFVYQIVLDRFAGDTPFTDAQLTAPLERRVGGTLRGLLRVVESGFFEATGVNVLWISPLYDNPEDWRVGREGGAAKYVGYHGYWPAADRAVEPAFGTEADVDALVRAAHDRGLRVIMDAVLNHVDATHPLVTDHPAWVRTPACVCGAAACPWSTHIETCWFTEYLPDIDWRAEGALEHQVETALWWMERFDLDGLRLDAVPMMPRLVTRRMAARVHARFEGLRERQMLLGETYTGLEGHDLIRWYLGPDGLDSQFDFPLMWRLRETLARDDLPLTALQETVNDSARAWYGSTAVMATMIGNHDVPRFVDATSPLNSTNPTGEADDPLQRTRLALSTVLALPGMPVLYYGDEIGLAGAYDPANRAPMRFADAWTPAQASTRAAVARAGRLRACSPALRRGALTGFVATDDTLAFWRGAEDTHPALFVLNRSAEPRTVRVPLPGRDLLPLVVATGAATVGDAGPDGLSLRLPAHTASVLLTADDPCTTEAAP